MGILSQALEQRFPTGALQKSLKHAIPASLIKDNDLFSLRLSNKKMTTANTAIAMWCEGIKIIPIFLSDRQKNIFWRASEF